MPIKGALSRTPGLKSRVVVYVDSGTKITIESDQIKTLADFRALSGKRFFTRGEVPFSDPGVTAIMVDFDNVVAAEFYEYGILG